MTFAIFLLYLALSYLYPGELVPALAPYRLTFWTGTAGVVIALAPLMWRNHAPLASFQLWLLLLFTGVMSVSVVLAEEWFGAVLMVLQRFGPALTIFILAVCSVTSLARLRVAAACVVALTVALVIQGTAAYHLGYNAQLFLLDRTVTADNDEDAEDIAGDDPEEASAASDVLDDLLEDDEWQELPRIRALGFMHDPNDLAVGMLVALGLIGGVWRPGLRPRDLLLTSTAVALVYGIYLTRSRGGAVALVIVLWQIAAGHFGRATALGVLAVLGAGALTIDFGGRSLAGGLDASASGRLEAWTEGLEMLKAQPMLGVGYGQFVEHHTLTAHNALVLCFAETGLIGCFLWVGLLVVTLLELHCLTKLAGEGSFEETVRRWSRGLQLGLIGFMVAAFFLSRTFVPTLYLVIGLSAALAAVARSAGKSIPLPSLPGLGALVFACELAGVAVVYGIVKLYVV